jgi:hypothetical protein
MSRRRAAGRRPGQIPGLLIIGVVGVFVAVFAVAMLIFTSGGGEDSGEDRWFARPVENYPYPVEMFEAEVGATNRHFASGEFQGYGSVSYATDPPTSGRHLGELFQKGISDLVVPNEVAVHNMEHGYVIVWYNCNADPVVSTEECAALKGELASVVQPAVSGGKLVILSPDSTMEHRIALTSWQFMDVLEAFDADRVETYIDTFECHYDPEGTC